MLAVIILRKTPILERRVCEQWRSVTFSTGYSITGCGKHGCG